MKGKPNVIGLMLLIFTISIIGSEAFSVLLVHVYSNYGVSVANPSLSSAYQELVTLVIALFATTAIFLLLIKYRFRRVMLGIVLVITGLILLEFFSIIIQGAALYGFGFNLLSGSTAASIVILGIYAAAILSIVYYFKFAGKNGRNVINVMVFITVSSIISLALGVLPSVILLVVIAVYDYISVFVTKHMVTLAKGLGNFGFLAGISLSVKKPKKVRRVGLFLGGGDIVFPAILVDALLLRYPPIAAALASVGALAGLFTVLIVGKKGKFYPAMSFIVPFELLFLGAYFLIALV